MRPRPRLFRSVVLLGLLLAACQQRESATQAGNKSLVPEFFGAIDTGNLERVGELVTDDLALHVVGLPQPLTKDELMGAIKAFYAAFPDNTHEIHQTLAEGDFVTVRLTQHATHRAEYEGIRPTGNQVTIGAIHIMRFAGGKIQEWWALEDNLGLMQQLGAELKPPALP